MWTELALWVGRGRAYADQKAEMDGVLAAPIDWYLATWWTFGAELGLLSFDDDAPAAESVDQPDTSLSTRA